jgi:uncharacterized protein with HEPN domain
MARDKATLLDIARAAQLILEFKQGIDKAAFLQDFKTQSTVLHQLMVMGEAVNVPDLLSLIEPLLPEQE